MLTLTKWKWIRVIVGRGIGEGVGEIGQRNLRYGKSKRGWGNVVVQKF